MTPRAPSRCRDGAADRSGNVEAMKAVRIHEYGGPEVPRLRGRRDAGAGARPGAGARQGRGSQPGRRGRAPQQPFRRPSSRPRRSAPTAPAWSRPSAPSVGRRGPGRRGLLHRARHRQRGQLRRDALIAAVQAVHKPANVSFEEAAAWAWPSRPPGTASSTRRPGGRRDCAGARRRGWRGQRRGAAGPRPRRPRAGHGRQRGRRRARARARRRRHHRPHTADVPAEVGRLTDGKGVDVIIELVISANLAADFGMIVKGGRIVGIGGGQSPGAHPQRPGDRGRRHGALCQLEQRRPRRRGRDARVASLVEQGVVRPVVGHVLPCRRHASARAARRAPLRQDRAGALVRQATSSSPLR